MPRRSRPSTHLLVAVALALAGAGVLAGCADPTASAQPSTLVGRDLGTSDASTLDLAAADLALGLDLVGDACASDPAASQHLSPLSISSALTLLSAGARGPSAVALQGLLHLPPYGDALMTSLRQRRDALRPLTQGTKAPLTMGDSVWLQTGLPVLPDYLDRVTTAQDARVLGWDFQADPNGGREAVNRSVTDATRGRITDLLPEGAVTSLTRVLLVNTVALDADWKVPFDPDGTHAGRFTRADGSTTAASYLSSAGELRYAEEAGWRAVVLPYVGDRLELVAALPAAGQPTCSMPSREALDRLAGAAPAQVALRLPRLQLSERLDLLPLLAPRGLAPLLDPATADLSGVAGQPGDLVVGAAVHAATLRVDEKGTQAAAATGVTVRVASSGRPEPALRLDLDRPFLLLLRDRVTREPLFLTRVADPGSG